MVFDAALSNAFREITAWIPLSNGDFSLYINRVTTEFDDGLSGNECAQSDENALRCLTRKTLSGR